MKKQARSLKGRRILLALLLAAALLAPFILAPHPAQAACPAPGGGYAGAANMLHDAKMFQTMVDHVPQQGWDGMHTAVVNSSCP